MACCCKCLLFLLKHSCTSTGYILLLVICSVYIAWHVKNLNDDIDKQRKYIYDMEGNVRKLNDDIYQQKRYTNNMEENFKRTSAEIINGQIEMWQFTTKLEKQLREIQDRLNIRQDFSIIKMAKRIISQGINLVFHSLLGPLYGLLSSGVQTYLLDYHDGDY